MLVLRTECPNGNLWCRTSVLSTTGFNTHTKGERHIFPPSRNVKVNPENHLCMFSSSLTSPPTPPTSFFRLQTGECGEGGHWDHHIWFSHWWIWRNAHSMNSQCLFYRRPQQIPEAIQMGLDHCLNLWIALITSISGSILNYLGPKAHEVISHLYGEQAQLELWKRFGQWYFMVVITFNMHLTHKCT